jgi:hypothetical protein
LKKRAPSTDFIMSKHRTLQMLYAERNAEFETLRKVFDGDFSGLSQNKAIGKSDLFNEHIAIVYNISNAIVRRYMDMMSAPPRIECLPRGFDEDDQVLADKRTKFLEHIWRANNMTLKIIMSAFYQSLLDRGIFHVRPAPHLKHKILIELCVPEYYMPMPQGDNYLEPAFTIYGFRAFDPMRSDVIAGETDPLRTRPNFVFNQVVEYWDDTWMVRVEDGKGRVEIEHGFGAQNFYEAMNIPVPHRYRGQGDIDQSAGMNAYVNMLFSDFANIINYAANPITIIRGAGDTSALNFAPKAIWNLGREGQAQFLQWQGAPPTSEAQFLRALQAIEDLSGVNSPALGRDIPSGTSGSALRSVLAGFNTRTGTKQQCLGEALARMNVGIQMTAERVFSETEYEIVGEIPAKDKRGRDVLRRGAFTFKPKEIGGWYANELHFEPVDPTTRFFQELEKKREKLQSRLTTMRNLNIRNPSDEIERMRREDEEEAQAANRLALGQKGELPPQLPGLDAAPPAEGGAMDMKEVLDALGTDKDRAKLLLGGPGNGAPPADPLEDPENKVAIDDVLGPLRGLELGGQAYVTGELAKLGSTGGDITIELDELSDEPVIRQALGKLSGRAKFRRRTGPDVGSDKIPFGKGQKKKVAAETPRTVALDKFLRLIVTEANRQPGSGAWVFAVACLGPKRSYVPLGNTNAQKRVDAEQGEIISVHIDGLSRKPDGKGWRYALVKPEVVKTPSVPAEPTTLEQLEKMFEDAIPKE